METTFILFLGIILLLVVYTVFGLFTMSLNDFIEKKIIVKTLWLWLPFHALRRLSKEFGEKYLK